MRRLTSLLVSRARALDVKLGDDNDALVPRSFELSATPTGVDLIVTGPWSKEARAALLSGAANGLVLNYAKGFQEANLEFLHGLPLARLDLLARTITDLSPVYTCAETLTSLSIESDPRAHLEADRFPLLERLAIDWAQVETTIRYCSRLEDLYIGSYSEHDLTPLAMLKPLTRLRMKDRPRLVSLDGLEDLTWLRELGIFGAQNLHDISAVARARSPLLTRLELESDGRITDLQPVAACTSLTFLNAANCGNLSSAEPLRALRHLETLYLYESTRFTDGDLTAVEQLPRLRDLRLMNRRHYRPSVPQIEETIAARHEQSF